MEAKTLGDALQFAIACHSGQVRKYTEEPYIFHPIAVCTFVEQWGGTVDQRIAALLHDVTEDCGVPNFLIEDMFGRNVALMVNQLTDYYTPEAFPNLSRAERKAKEAETWMNPVPGAALVKACDLLHNTQSTKSLAPDFWKTYRIEKGWMLEQIGNQIPSGLAEILFRQIEEDA